MNKTLILIHGRSWKPPEESLKRLWLDAITWGLSQDSPEAAAKFENIDVEFIYFGDLNNQFLEEAKGETWQDDTASRRETFEQLRDVQREAFIAANYQNLPGRSGWKARLARGLSPVLSFLTLGDEVIERVAPDMGEYWNVGSEFGTKVRLPMIQPLKDALDRDASTAIVAHSLGSMISYDTLWKFSWKGEYANYWRKKVDLFLTLGSPLGDGTVQSRLKGERASGNRRYPNNIRRWVNIAAQDDYISHDRSLANDYRKMEKLELIDSIEDHEIYNLAVRDGRSNPHHAVGYLIHPTTTAVLTDWILA